MKTTIEAYTITIRKKREKEPWSFADSPDIYKLLSDSETGFIKYIDKNVTGDLPAEKMTVRGPPEGHDHSDLKRYICGIIETGYYGKEYEAVDKDDPKDETKKIFLGKSKAILKPFFYYIQIPRKGDKALVILERIDNNGIFPLIRSILISFLNFHFGAGDLYIIDRGSVVLGAYLKKLREGKYNSLSLSANSIQTDASERYFGGLASEDFTLELTMKFKKNMSEVKEKKIREMVNSGKYLFDSPELNAIFEDSTQKVSSTIGGGKTRTLYLNDEEKNIIHPYYDLDVNRNTKGFSDYESIKKATKKFIEDNPDFKVFE